VKDLGDLAALRLDDQRWFMFQNMGPEPSKRSGHAMATSGEHIVVLGGFGASEKEGKQDVVHVLDSHLIKYPPIKPVSPSLQAQ